MKNNSLIPCLALIFMFFGCKSNSKDKDQSKSTSKKARQPQSAADSPKIKVTARLVYYTPKYQWHQNSKAGHDDGIAPLGVFKVMSPEAYQSQKFKILFKTRPELNLKTLHQKHKIYEMIIPQALFSSSANTLDNSMVINFSVKLPPPSSDPVPPPKPNPGQINPANLPNPDNYDQNHQQLDQTQLPDDYVLCKPRSKDFKKSFCGCTKNLDCTSIRGKRRFGDGFCDACSYWPINKAGASFLNSYYSKKRPRICPLMKCAPLISTIPKCKNNICILHGPRSRPRPMYR